MTDSPPAIKRNYPGAMRRGVDDDSDDMADRMMLFPSDDNDSTAFMSPGLISAQPQHDDDDDNNNERRCSPVMEYPNDECSRNDASPPRLGSKVSVAETKTTAQMTNLTEQSEHPRSKDAWDFELELMTKAKVFCSVLLQPIPVWNEMEEAVLQYARQWKPSQRSKLIELWVKFMELKVIVEDYGTNEDDLLLEPTELVGRVWYSIAENSHLYQEVTFWIQDFHHKDRRLFYRPPLTLSKTTEEDASNSTSDGHNFDTKVYDDSSDHAQFQETRHHKLERAQRLFICYFQQAMPESLKAVSNMSKRQSSPTPEIQENNIVPENASDDENSDFEDGDDDDEEDEEEYTYGDKYFEMDNRTTHTEEYTAASESNNNWITRFQSWLSCWDDPFSSNTSTVAATDANTRENRIRKKKRDRRKNVPDDELLQDQEASFWPCTTTDTTKAKDDEENEIRRSTNIIQPGDSPGNKDPVPDLNETDEGSSTLWVTFDTSKQDLHEEDDEMTFLTMDTALDQGSPDKRGKKAQFYSPPRRFGGAGGKAAKSPQSPKGGVSRPAAAAAPKTKNKLPNVTPPKPKGSKLKKKKDKNEKGGLIPDDWTSLKTKFRIASMIIKELE